MSPLNHLNHPVPAQHRRHRFTYRTKFPYDSDFYEKEMEVMLDVPNWLKPEEKFAEIFLKVFGDTLQCKVVEWIDMTTLLPYLPPY